MTSSDGSSTDHEGPSSGSDSGDDRSGEEEIDEQEPPNRRKISQWPKDKIIVEEIREDGMPLHGRAQKRFKKLAGLIGRQKISLAKEKVKLIKKQERMEIFNDHVMPYLEFVPDIKQLAFQKMWAIITKCRRDWRSRLAKTYLAEGISPYAKYGFIQKTEWEAFAQQQSTQDAVERSRKGKELRELNKHDHHLGSGGYESARERWQKQDNDLLAAGKENPWQQFPEGIGRDWVRARGSLTDSGSISFTQSAVEDVSKKMVDISSQSGQDNDVLSKALGKTLRRERVPGYEPSYSKRKKALDTRVEQLVEEKLAVKLAEQKESIQAEMRLEFEQKMASMLAAHGFASLPPSPAGGHQTQLNCGEDARKSSTNYLTKALSHYMKANKDYVMFVYNTVENQDISHWILVVILLKHNVVWYLDSSMNTDRDYNHVMSVIDTAFADLNENQREKKGPISHVKKFECHQQPDDNSCGFYACYHMYHIMEQSAIKTAKEIKISTRNLTDHELNTVTQGVALCLMDDVLRRGSEFECIVNEED